MVPALAFLVLVLVVVLLSRWMSRSRVEVRACCSARPWPPDDLTRQDAAAAERT